MSKQDRIILGLIFAFIALVIGVDITADAKEGASWWHIGAEICVALIALFGLVFIFRSAIHLRKKLALETENSARLRVDANEWKARAKTYIDGLSQAISTQMKEWGLSDAETEIAFMLLKGLSLREIAGIRGTSEKTTRAQAANIYLKSGLNGRADLAAFFLEDLLG